MARTRSIKPGFFDNELLGCLPPLTRILFIGLWCQADREGRLEDRPRKLKKTILGYDDVNADEVDGMLTALEKNGFIIRYRANDNSYIQVVNFVKHQNPHMKEKASEIPPPDGFEPCKAKDRREETQEEHQAGTGPEPGQHQHDPEEEETGPGEEPGAPAGGAEESKTALERRFELFWKAYPKKKAKKTAFNAFKKIKPNEELFNTIMDAIGRARTSKEWLKEGGQYIPNPASWLNGGCWDDEYDEMEVGSNGTDRGHPGPNNRRRTNGQTTEPPGTGIQGFHQADE